jgi:hypothetical protein
MTYDEYVARLAALLVVEPTDERFVTLLPWITESAELRILREPTFDFLATRGGSVSAGPTAAGDRSIPFPSSIIVAEQINLLTPANTQGSSATVIPLLRTTKEYIDSTWPNPALMQIPAPFAMYYAIRNQGNADPEILIAPTPNDSYYLTVYGTSRPTPLSSSFPSNFISIEMPDLLMAAAMVLGTGGILKAYGSQSDDPQSSMSWNAVYEGIKEGISIESMRQKAISSGWSEYPPAPLAATRRGTTQPGV